MFARLSTVVAALLLATAASALPGKEYKAPVQNSVSTSESTNIVNAPAENKCNYVGGQQCCDSVDYAGPDEMESLLSLFNLPISQETLVGHGCSPLIGADTTCNAQAVCCEDSYQGIGVSCNNFAL